MLTVTQEANRTAAHVETSCDRRHGSSFCEQLQRVRGRALVQFGAAVALAVHAHGAASAEVQVLRTAVVSVVVGEPNSPPPRVPKERLRYEPMDKPRLTLAIQAQVNNQTEARFRRPEYAPEAGSMVVLHATYPPPAAHFVQPDRSWTRCPPFPHHSRRHKRSVPRG